MPSIAPYMALRRNNTDQPIVSESRFREELDETPDYSLRADKHQPPAPQQQRARRYSLPSDGQPTPEEGVAGGSPPSLEKAAGRVKKLALRAGFNSTEASQSAPPSPGAGSRSPQPQYRRPKNPGITVATPSEDQKPELTPIQERDRGAPQALDPTTGNVKRPMTSLLPDASTWPTERDGTTSNGHSPRPSTALFTGPGAPGLERGGAGGRPQTLRAQAVGILMRDYSDLMVESKLRLLSALENEEKCEILVATRGEWRRIYLHSLIVEQAMSEKDVVIQSAVRGLRKGPERASFRILLRRWTRSSRIRPTTSNLRPSLRNPNNPSRSRSRRPSSVPFPLVDVQRPVLAAVSSARATFSSRFSTCSSFAVCSLASLSRMAFFCVIPVPSPRSQYCTHTHTHF
ncbi:hypothetical protein HDK77DRAFT_156957 [Phyllosticta capitalensis]